MFLYFISAIALVSASNFNEIFRHFDEVESGHLFHSQASSFVNVDISYRNLPLTLVLEQSKIVEPHSQNLHHYQGYVRHISNSQVRLSAKPGQGIVQGMISFGANEVSSLYIDSAATFGGNGTTALVYSLDDLVPEKSKSPSLFRRKSGKSNKRKRTRSKKSTVEPIRKLVTQGSLSESSPVNRSVSKPVENTFNHRDNEVEERQSRPVDRNVRNTVNADDNLVVEEKEEDESKPSPKGVCKMALIADAEWIRIHKNFEGGVEASMTGYINEVIAFEQQLNVRLEVTKIILDEDNSVVGERPRDSAGKIKSDGATSYYRDQVLHSSNEIDGNDYCAVLVFQGEEFDGGTNGKAYKNVVCYGRSNIGVVKFREGSRGRNKLLSTVAHELGHIFGAEHDDEEEGCANQGFLMDGDRDKTQSKAFLFSECSLARIKQSMSSSRVQQCLF